MLGTVTVHAFLGRKVAWSRWVSVAIVAVGAEIVERANRGRYVRTNENTNGGVGGEDRGEHRDNGGARQSRFGSHASDATIGVSIIVLQSTRLVLQDVGEEIFMQ